MDNEKRDYIKFNDGEKIFLEIPPEDNSISMNFELGRMSSFDISIGSFSEEKNKKELEDSIKKKVSEHNVEFSLFNGKIKYNGFCRVDTIIYNYLTLINLSLVFSKIKDKKLGLEINF